MPSFEQTYGEFLVDLENTFPEHKDTFVKLHNVNSLNHFVGVWRPLTQAVASQDESIFKDGVELCAGFSMNTLLWNQLSKNTQNAIWKYLSTLMLLAAQQSEFGFFDLSGFSSNMEKMMEMLKGGEGFHFEDLFSKLGKMAESFGFKDLSGVTGKFKIPERIFQGHIAKIAKELVAELRPEDFGISPELMASNDPTAVFKFLEEVFTKKPDMLMSITQKIANKIKTKFMRGEIRREEIIAEAEQLMKEFSENELFSELFGSLRDALVGSERASGNEGSTRRREAQERLRKKAAEKAAKKASADTNSIVNNMEAEIRAAQVAAELLAQESQNVDKKTQKKKTK